MQCSRLSGVSRVKWSPSARCMETKAKAIHGGMLCPAAVSQ